MIPQANEIQSEKKRTTGSWMRSYHIPKIAVSASLAVGSQMRSEVCTYLDCLGARVLEDLGVRLLLELSDSSVSVVTGLLPQSLGSLGQNDGSSGLLEEAQADDEERPVDDQLDPLDPPPALVGDDVSGVQAGMGW